MLTEFECKKCRNHVQEPALDRLWHEPEPGICLECMAKNGPPPPPPPPRNVRNDIRPELPPTVEHVRRSHRLELVWLPLAAMVVGFTAGVLTMVPLWWTP